MEVYTSEPGLQFYDGSYLKAAHPGLDGRPHFSHAGLCLEPGRFPDGPNHPNFPSPVLRAGEVYLPADDRVTLRQHRLMCPGNSAGQ